MQLRCLTEKEIKFANIFKILVFRDKVPDDSSEETKHVTYFCITIKCSTAHVVCISTSFIIYYRHFLARVYGDRMR
jgi:hypothetical protein